MINRTKVRKKTQSAHGYRHYLKMMKSFCRTPLFVYICITDHFETSYARNHRLYHPDRYRLVRSAKVVPPVLSPSSGRRLPRLHRTVRPEARIDRTPQATGLPTTGQTALPHVPNALHRRKREVFSGKRKEKVAKRLQYNKFFITLHTLTTRFPDRVAR